MQPIFDHKSTEFKKNEFKTLSQIQTRGFFDNDFSQLAADIIATHQKYMGANFAKTNFHFSSAFDMNIERHIHKVVIHAEVTGDYEFTSYSLGICDKNNSSDLIRRFHFDYDHTNTRKKQNAYISHLQYGGHSGNNINSMQFNTSKIEDWLSEPRLIFPPINLALLLDIVFCEFESVETRKIVEDPDWRSLVYNNEIFAQKKYYASISSHIDSPRHCKYKLVRDICYTDRK